MEKIEPGFYLDQHGDRRWWDGAQWGALESDNPLGGHLPSSADSTVLIPVTRDVEPSSEAISQPPTPQASPGNDADLPTPSPDAALPPTQEAAQESAPARPEQSAPAGSSPHPATSHAVDVELTREFNEGLLEDAQPHAGADYVPPVTSVITTVPAFVEDGATAKEGDPDATLIGRLAPVLPAEGDEKLDPEATLIGGIPPIVAPTPAAGLDPQAAPAQLRGTEPSFPPLPPPSPDHTELISPAVPAPPSGTEYPAQPAVYPAPAPLPGAPTVRISTMPHTKEMPSPAPLPQMPPAPATPAPAPPAMGAVQGGVPMPPAMQYPGGFPQAPMVNAPGMPVPPLQTPPRRGGNKVLIVSLVSTLVLVASAGLATYLGMERWDKVVKEEHPETFREELKEGDNYDVNLSAYDVCYVGQKWDSCIEDMIFEYNTSCANRPLSDQGSSLCSDYKNAIDDMQNRPNRRSLSVASLGSIQKRLETSKEIITEKVSNNDYEPAKTEPAYCFFGVIWDCPTAKDRERMKK